PSGQVHQTCFVPPWRLGALGAIVIPDVHVESCAAPGDGSADATEAQYAQALAADPTAEREGAVVGAAPAAASHIALGVTYASRCREDKRPRQVCHAVIQHVGRIADLDAL